MVPLCFLYVVEFPAVLLNLSTGEVESKFQQYVQPSEHKKLSPFCMELTGITQVGVRLFLIFLKQIDFNSVHH